ncbi:MAG TPA: beta-propeller fold lactonase family protein [Actinomycetota bacterium]|nr:beta-propeller fold lactonase family protein [Actinomycetota bacterium]
MNRSFRRARIYLAAIAVATVPLAAAAPAIAVEAVGHVYVQTNHAAGNSVVSYARAADGTLTYEETVPTGGLGLGAGLGSQAAVAITDDGGRLLAVNAGSDDVSLFEVTPNGLELADVRPVGDRPVSVDVHGSIVYVLNQGADTIQGVRITEEGTLAKVPHSVRPLSGAGVAAAQVAFSPDGRLLAVTEKATQTIDTFRVRPNGRAIGPKAQASVGATPFGFEFGPDGRLFVSEAPTSSASSYDVAADGTIDVITASLANGGGAACWLVVSPDGRFAYTANATSDDVSRYGIAADGSLTLEAGTAGETDPGPVDLDVTEDALYVLNSRSGSISAFAVGSDGSLTPIAGASGFAAGRAGLVAV